MKIALVCDFMYPRLGGVEMHIYSLASCLVQLGHKVIIITHAYNCPNGGNGSSSSTTTTNNNNESSPSHHQKRTGVRYLPGPIKVYYCPILPMTDEDALPTFTATFPLLRWILIREGIELVHSHQATSTMANEAVVYAGEMGLPSVYTDHSLFGFNDVASVVLNRVLKTTLCTVGAVICVSHVCRDNFIMRAHMDPSIVRVIPNAIDVTKFTPDVSKRSKERITIVVVSRLVYRKGIELLLHTIPLICHSHPHIDFLIGGSGPYTPLIQNTIRTHSLSSRVTMLGSVHHSDVRDVLVRGHIFLNCSLTESFCIAVLEAASCGLYVVSTNVGGVPEVLPEDMISLCDPSVEGLVGGLEFALGNKVRRRRRRKKNSTGDREEEGGDGDVWETAFDSWEFHKRVGRAYCWNRVAKETLEVYKKVKERDRLTFLERLERFRSVGPTAGVVTFILAVTFHFYARVVEWWQPRCNIDVVPDLPVGGGGDEGGCVRSGDELNCEQLRRDAEGHEKML